MIEKAKVDFQQSLIDSTVGWKFDIYVLIDTHIALNFCDIITLFLKCSEKSLVQHAMFLKE